MKKHIYNEQNGLHDTLHGDVYLPEWAVLKDEHLPIGKIRQDAPEISKGAVPGPP